MIKIRVPATSANVGCGYDCLGLALTMYTTFSFEEIDHDLQFVGCEERFANKHNLIYTSFMKTLAILQKEVSGVRIGIDSQVPVSRGLGSSATCVVGGIYGAYALTNTPIDKAKILRIATDIEGHPDNVAPAIYGGLRASCMVQDQTYSVAYEIDRRFLFQALVPNFETLTEDARKAIPKTIAHQDAVFTLSRLSVVLKAFETYDVTTLQACTQDALHEPYRIPLIHEYAQVKAICEKIDSICFFVSGSGSTLLNVMSQENNDIEIQNALSNLSYEWKTYLLKIDYEGAIQC